MSLLFQALQTLDSSERKAFSKMLHSPFFNNRPALAKLGDYLLLCLSQNSRPEEAKMFELVVQSEKVSLEQSLRLANSALLKLLEAYLIWVENNLDKGRQQIALAAAYRKRGASRHFKIILREAREEQERGSLRNAQFFENNFLLEWEQYQFEVSGQRATTLNIQASSDAMDTAFMANKLRLACLAISHQAIYKTDYELAYLQPVIATIENDPALVQLPALGLYYYCYRFLTEAEGESHFEAFRLMLEQATSQFPEPELRLLYLLAINYSIKRVNRSEKGAIETALQLYKSALQFDLLLENGSISRFAFSNIVAIALRAGETDWVAEFIEKYKSKIERQWREATASLCLARLEYERKQFEKALLYLQRADYKDTMNNLTAKMLQMKIYYETGASDTLQSHLKNLKNFIKRHTAIGYHRTNYSNIVRFTETLLLLNPLDKSALKAFRKAVEEEAVLTEKEWLLGRLGK